MRVCSFVGCTKKHKAHGYCNYHFNKAKRKGIIGISKCSAPGCDLFSYAKGLCHSHLGKMKRTGTTETIVPCPVPGCENTMRYSMPYCRFHLSRFRKGLSLTASEHELKSGENNVRWSGGNSPYPNHYQMKLMRKRKVKETKGRCEHCGERGRVMHHKDFSKTEHEYSNFVFLCLPCHIAEHVRNGTKWGRPKGSPNKKGCSSEALS